MRQRSATKLRGGTATFQALARLALAVVSLAVFACLASAWRPSVYDVAMIAQHALIDRANDEPRAGLALPPTLADDALQLSAELEDELEDEIDDLDGSELRPGLPSLRAEWSLARGACGESLPGATASLSARSRATLERALPRGPPRLAIR